MPPQELVTINLNPEPNNQEIEQMLRGGQTVTRTMNGGSMAPFVNKGEGMVLSPTIEAIGIKVGDVVACTIAASRGRGGITHPEPRYFFHLVVGVAEDGLQIANARGWVNGITAREAVFGIATDVIDYEGKRIPIQQRMDQYSEQLALALNPNP